MIHFKKDGEYFKLGLNLSLAPYGFVATWVWFDFAKCETFSARLRLRLHRSPRILWSVQRVNIIEGYLRRNNFTLIHREILEDLYKIEDQYKNSNERFAHINPEAI